MPEERAIVVYKRPSDLALLRDVPICCNLLVCDMFDEGVRPGPGPCPTQKRALRRQFLRCLQAILCSGWSMLDVQEQGGVRGFGMHEGVTQRAGKCRAADERGAAGDAPLHAAPAGGRRGAAAGLRNSIRPGKPTVPSQCTVQCTLIVLHQQPPILKDVSSSPVGWRCEYAE